MRRGLRAQGLLPVISPLEVWIQQRTITEDVSDGTNSIFFCTALADCQTPITFPPNGKEG